MPSHSIHRRHSNAFVAFTTLLVVSLSALPAVPAVAQSPADTRREAPGLLPAKPVTEAGEGAVVGGTRRPVTPLPSGVAPGSVRPDGLRVTDAVRLLPSSQSIIRFRVDVPEPTYGSLESDPAVQTIEMDGYETLGEVGDPAVPRRVVNVAVPPNGDVRVRAAGGAVVLRDAVVLAPTPFVSRETPEVERYVRNGEAYWSAEPVAPDRARLLGVSWMRNQRIARIEILPVDYTASSGTVRAYRSVDVEVQIAPTGPVGPRAERVDPFETVYAQTLINYEQGKAWRRVAADAPGAELFAPAHVSGVPTTSVFAGRLWAKISIPSTGFYKINFSTLRNLAIFGGSTTTHVDSVRLFNWPGRPVLPEYSYCDSCDYREVGIQFSEGGNDTLDQNSEYIYFFAMGPSDWEDLYDPLGRDTVFLNNPYEDTNYYFLTVATAASPVGGAPRRIPTRSGAVGDPTGTVTPTTFDARAHFELDAEYFPDPTPIVAGSTLFWEKWYWRSLNIGSSFTATADLPDIDPAQPTRFRLSAWGIFAEEDTCFFQRFPDHFMDIEVNATQVYDNRGWSGQTGHVADTVLSAGLFQETGNQVRISIPAVPTCTGRIDRVGFAWFDVFYQRTFEAMGDTLFFKSPETPGDYVYRIPGFTAATPPRVFDVTDAYDPVEILGFDYVDQGGSFELAFRSNEAGPRRYRVTQSSLFTDRGVQSVVDASTASLTNLRQPPRDGMGLIQPVDYLVIYYDAFKAAADSLTEWRKTRLPLLGASPPYATYSVPISAIYDQFSGGRDDPGAVRNFLRAADANWPAFGGTRPAFVTFLGDASHDFKNYLGRALPGQPGTLIPSYEGGYDFFVSRQYATDDWMLNVDDPTRVVPDFFGGRIPAGDPAAALTYVVNKLLPYERRASFGEWRNRVMFIGDDDKQGEDDDPLRWAHIRQNSELDTLTTPNHVDRDYVYLHKYPDGPGATKPGAKAAIINGINDGVVMVNFIGHGSPFKITDESVFLDTDTGTLTNSERFTVFVAASCDIGKYNDPTVQSLGERLVLEPRGGAVGVVSATELALSSQNARLNQTFYTFVFTRDSVTSGRYEIGMAQALSVAKLGSSSTTEKYQIMGDAALQLNLPRLWVEFSIFDSAGTTPLTEIKRGQTVTYRGQVADLPGGPPLAFNGVVGVLIEDSAPLEQAPPCFYNPNCPLSLRPFYYYKAGPMFRGDAGVSNGTFEGRFVAPLEAKLGPRGRLRAYVEGQVAGQGFTTDGVGDLRFQMSDGTPSVLDDRGPRITLSFPGGATAVRPDAVLTVDLFDESGILTTGHTPQNSIIVTVDGNTTNRTDITDTFRYAADSYQSGRAAFQLPNLAEGGHRIEVSAADNLAAGLGSGAHRSSASLDFAVVAQPPLEISRAYLFPNPTESGGPRSGGQFVVDTPGDSVNVMVRLYTVTGKLVRVLKAFGGLGQVQLPWDGLDENGHLLANGVYYFKVHVSPRAADGTSEAGRKATAEGRVVVVNRD